jgi:chromosome segregation ATPase
MPRRLIIKSIELENFKSYAGKVIIGPFNKVNDYIRILHQ